MLNGTFSKTALAICAAACCGYASAAPVSVDGVIGSEWAGVSVVYVTHDDSAAIGNFQSATSKTAGASYSVRVRGDGSFVYVALQITGDAAKSAGNFANLYFDTNPAANDGSDVGFEVTNNDYFIAGDPNNVKYPASAYLTYNSSVDGTIELAISNDFFTSSPQAGPPYPAGFPAATSDVVLRLSQSFGYSVGGGAEYGDDRLGRASILAPDATTVPEPTSIALALLALGAVGASRRARPATRG